MKTVQISNATQTLPEVLRAWYCNSFFCRFRGLMFRDQLEEGWGLLLVQRRENRRDAAIHMFFVQMDLGIIWMDQEQRVVDCQLAKKWRPLYTPAHPAKYVLEVTPEWLDHIKIGDILDFEEIHSH